jgi:DNA-binding NtrC family response regulator
VEKKRIKILLGLERNTQTVEIAERLGESFDVIVVHDAEEAYQKIHSFDPDIAIFDYGLAKIHPIELHEGISMVHFYIHVVICVNEENLLVARRIWQKRAIDFILKPFDLERFINDVHKIVRHVIDQRTIERLAKKIESLESEIGKLRGEKKESDSF